MPRNWYLLTVIHRNYLWCLFYFLCANILLLFITPLFILNWYLIQLLDFIFYLLVNRLKLTCNWECYYRSSHWYCAWLDNWHFKILCLMYLISLRIAFLYGLGCLWLFNNFLIAFEHHQLRHNLFEGIRSLLEFHWSSQMFHILQSFVSLILYIELKGVRRGYLLKTWWLL